MVLRVSNWVGVKASRERMESRLKIRALTAQVAEMKQNLAAIQVQLTERDNFGECRHYGGGNPASCAVCKAHRIARMQ